MIDNQGIDFLKHVLTFWPRLSREQEEILLSNTQYLHCSAGETIHSASHECAGVLVVHRGELRTYILSEDGRDITLYRLVPGEVCVLSASCILSSITFDVHIDTEKDSGIFLINPIAFANLISQNIYAENFALHRGMERFSDVMWAMEQILFMSFDKRLAVFLIDETAKTGTDSLSLTHEQIARYMGSAREVVSRMLKHFSEEGMVELSRGGVRILNRTKIMRLVP